MSASTRSGSAEGDFVQGAHGGGHEAARRDESPVADERVQQRHERVEHEAGAAIPRERPPERHDEVAGVADDHHVDVQPSLMLSEEATVGAGHAGEEPGGAGRARHPRRRQRRQRRLELVHRDAVLPADPR